MNPSLSNLKHLPGWAENIINDLVPRLVEMPGVLAVVLGGSLARDRGASNSDLDLGLLYTDASPINIAAVQSVIEEVNDDLLTVATPLGGWGPWVNGGAWLHIHGHAVDLLYRSIDRYRATIDNARNGFAEHDYLQQPPFGFQSTIYLGEIDSCVALSDPTGIVSELKALIRPYPPKLKFALTSGYHWGADFSVQNAAKPAARGDLYAVAGCLSRAVAFLVQSLFAANEIYFISDKGAIEAIEAMPLRPDSWSQRVHELLTLTDQPDRLQFAVQQASELVTEARQILFP